jgi:hypothetical protein
MDTKITDAELEIPASLKRAPSATEIIPDIPVEVERQFVTIEEEGGIEVTE